MWSQKLSEYLIKAFGCCSIILVRIELLYCNPVLQHCYNQHSVMLTLLSILRPLGQRNKTRSKRGAADCEHSHNDTTRAIPQVDPLRSANLSLKLSSFLTGPCSGCSRVLPA